MAQSHHSSNAEYISLFGAGKEYLGMVFETLGGCLLSKTLSLYSIFLLLC